MLMCFAMANAFGAMLSGNIDVHQTSETAAKAKINASNYARRQVLYNVVSQYSDSDALTDLLQKSSNEDLMNLVASTSVANEHISSTGYSANITVNFDNDAVKQWLNANSVQNWVPSTESTEKFTSLIVLSNGIPDWAEIKRITREGNVEIETQSITGNQVIVKLPLNYRTKFTVSIREAGWKYSDNEGVLQIWK